MGAVEYFITKQHSESDFTFFQQVEKCEDNAEGQGGGTANGRWVRAEAKKKKRRCGEKCVQSKVG